MAAGMQAGGADSSAPIATLLTATLVVAVLGIACTCAAALYCLVYRGKQAKAGKAGSGKQALHSLPLGVHAVGSQAGSTEVSTVSMQDNPLHAAARVGGWVKKWSSKKNAYYWVRNGVSTWVPPVDNST